MVELVGAAGLDTVEELKPRHINRRVQGANVKTYAQLYPSVTSNCLLDQKLVPEDWRDDWENASAKRWG